MKFFLAVALIVSMASAASVPATSVTGRGLGELQEIIAAINSPSTDPATAVALEQMLFDILGLSPIAVGPAIVDNEPISIGPAIIESNPISVGPALIDFPLPDNGVVAEESIVQPAPVIVAPVAEAEASSAPLVQIILNIRQTESTAAVNPAPAVIVPAEINPSPVNVIESVFEPAPEPIQVIEAAPQPIQVVEVAPQPIQVIESAPVVVEPVIIGTPIIPAPAVVLPETLN